MKAAVIDTFPVPPGSFAPTADADCFIHACPTCGRHSELTFGARGNGHRLTSSDPFTIVGSIICPHGCGAHYLVTNGAIVNC